MIEIIVMLLYYADTVRFRVVPVHLWLLIIHLGYHAIYSK